MNTYNSMYTIVVYKEIVVDDGTKERLILIMCPISTCCIAHIIDFCNQWCVKIKTDDPN